MFAAPYIYSYDIETDNSQGQGLNPAQSRITEISVSTAQGDVVFADADEYDLLRAFDTLLSRDLAPGLLSDWNGTFFDLPFVGDRQSALDLKLGMILIPSPGLTPKYDLLPGHVHGYTALWQTASGVPHQHLDIMFAYKKDAADLGVGWSLKPVAKAHGIEMVELDRTKLHEYTAEERAAYNASDSRGTRELTIRKLGA